METTNIKKWIEDAEGDKHADNLTEFGENLLKEIKALLKVCEAKQSEQQSNCNLPHVSKSEGITCEAQLNAFIEWHDNLSIEELAWYEGRYLEIFKSI